MKDEELSSLMFAWSEAFLQTSMQDFNRLARAGGLSMLQLTVLLGIYHGGPHEVTAFADIMQISPAGASQMVERLVQEGMVERQPAEGDRRVREVHLTDLGRARVEASIAERRKLLEELVEDLPASSRSIVSRALAILIEQMEHVRQRGEDSVAAPAE